MGSLADFATAAAAVFFHHFIYLRCDWFHKHLWLDTFNAHHHYFPWSSPSGPLSLSLILCKRVCALQWEFEINSRALHLGSPMPNRIMISKTRIFPHNFFLSCIRARIFLLFFVIIILYLLFRIRLPTADLHIVQFRQSKSIIGEACVKRSNNQIGM